MSLLIVGAHALDGELMAGTLAAVASAAGWPVALVHLTLGERGHPQKPPAEFGPQLQEEAARASRVLGAEAVWSGAAAPLAAADVLDWLVAELDRRRPELVVTHWRGSWHSSHRTATAVVQRALAAVAGEPVLAFGENCEDLLGFLPTHVLPVAAVRDQWLRAVEEYELFRRSVPGSGVAAEIPYWAYYTAALRVHGLHFGLREAAVFRSERTLPPELGFRPITPG